ncbi:MAG: EAL domain-containing protein [Phycisphaerales bacterium]|nr:EAL domain-containing protein [Phycisphaerales bacterium]
MDSPHPKNQTKPHASESFAALADLIGRKDLSIYLQPILDMRTGEAVGYEALARPGITTGFAGAIDLFDAAAAANRMWELEAVTREQALERARELDPQTLLFLNNSPQTFTDPRFVPTIEAELARAGLQPSRIVLEITERTEIEANATMIEHVKQLKSMGFQVALDDAGAGASGLNRLMQLRPHWLKLDRELIDRVDEDRYKTNLVRLLVRFCRLSGVKLLAEGMEREEELNVLIDSGVEYGQGFFLGRPAPAPQSPASAIVGKILRRARGERRDSRESPIRTLARRCTTVQAFQSIGEVASRLLSFAADGGVVVLDGRRCVGWCPMNKILSLASTRKRSDQIGRHAVVSTAALHPGTSVKSALELASVRDEDELGLPLILHDDAGETFVVPLRALLAAAAASQAEAPGREVDPLTGLPARVAADMRIEELLRGDWQESVQAPIEAAFIDLRGFGELNATMGYATGDNVIKEVAAHIRRHVTDPIPGSFLCHLGEDRFLVLGPDVPMRQNIERFVASFSKLMQSSDEFDDGSIARIGPDGLDLPSCPLALRVLMVGPLRGRIQHARSLYVIESQLRQKARSIEESLPNDQSVIINDDRAQRQQLRASA